MLEFIKGFFERGTIDSSLEIFYALLGTLSFSLLILCLLPKKYAVKWIGGYGQHELDRDKFDWQKTLRNTQHFLGFFILFSSFFILLNYLIGMIATDIGIWLAVILLFAKGRQLDPVKKEAFRDEEELE
ncbi:hypothetical protein [Marinilactibacillus piezotolerans]|uniref:hypothetical protein n=1 Tax=Marinilactibacillus piezotolerans TaxID=258723 RepID=UPI0009B037F3|nr:hypothetical protein [Marinilactibacillus piezotolerans]